MEHDPFGQLEDWAKKTERKVRWERRRRAGRRLLLWTIAAAAVAGLVLASVPVVKEFLHGPSGADAAPYPTQSLPDGIGVTSSRSAAPTDPFRGTPAASYAKGADGITLPPAQAVAGFTAAQVRASLAKVRATMIEGRLDERTLVGHQNAAYLANFAPNARTGMASWFGTATRENATTWIDPSVRLDPHEQPRVSGRVTYASVPVDGRPTLRVTTNFIWVYAFAVPGEHPIAAVHDLIEWNFPDQADLRDGDKGMWFGDSHAYTAWIDCAADAKGLLAPTKVAAAPEPSESEDPANYLRADHSLTIDSNCKGRS